MTSRTNYSQSGYLCLVSDCRPKKLSTLYIEVFLTSDSALKTALESLGSLNLASIVEVDILRKVSIWLLVILAVSEEIIKL